MWPFKPRSRSPSSYEKILDRISSRIRKSDARVQSLRYSSRRSNGLFSLYSILAYFGFLAYAAISRTIVTQPEIIGLAAVSPFIIWIIRRVITFIFGKLIDREEAYLNKLKAERQGNIEDLKSSMKYYSTKSLIDRFDLANANDGEDENNNHIYQPSNELQQLDQPILAQRQFVDHDLTTTPHSPKWYDRILDLIVGEDETSIRTRYALICSNCYSHNGLAPPGDTPEQVRYICPACGVTNGREVRSGKLVHDVLVEDVEEEAEELQEEEQETEQQKLTEQVITEKPTNQRLRRRTKDSAGLDSSLLSDDSQKSK
ncbi:hypothetical protein V1514DRAFT_334503 [Lipomyces japonicus]|uniref:uncharacterized protein n=1 Tax=Lipomyces japonicus TaxID=56871 RepID=UPI0034CEF75F